MNGVSKKGHSKRASASPSTTKLILLSTLLASVMVLFQNILQGGMSTHASIGYESLLPTSLVKTPTSTVPNTNTISFVNTTRGAAQPYGPLGVPEGEAQNLPSIRVKEPHIDSRRRRRDGVGDKRHLGGFEIFDMDGISPATWKHMITKYGIKSVLDVGCGRGISTAWFITHGVRTLCVEGSRDAIEKTVLDNVADVVVEHDYARGPWWPADTYSACWVSEFLEHVSLQFLPNYLPTLRKCAIIFATSSRWGGWHHVEVHTQEWWIRKFKSLGFLYDKEMTDEIRKVAKTESQQQEVSPVAGKPYAAMHILARMNVFMNPLVASLPQHTGLFAELGCYEEVNRKWVHRECGTGGNGDLETRMAPELFPLDQTEKMDELWKSQIERSIGNSSNTPAPNSDTKEAYEDHVPDCSLIHPLVEFWNKSLSVEGLPSFPVVAWPYIEKGVGSAESIHVTENGLKQSHYLFLIDSLLNFTDPNVIWIGDTGYGSDWNTWCHDYLGIVLEAKRKRREVGICEKWPIFIIDFTDGWGNQRCKNIEAEVGKDYVFYSTRSLIFSRYYSSSRQWVNPGRVLSNRTTDGVVYRQTPLTVRSDTVEALQMVLKEKHNMTLSGSVERIARDIDIAHLWPVEGNTVGRVKSKLRDRVSKLVTEMGEKYQKKTYVDLAGSAVRIGRRGVKEAYIDVLLGSKIVVVTQRDAWEDHYRLFEAIVCGALVITDGMLLKPEGLINGTSFVEVNSALELEEKILYYLDHESERLAIARQGRYTAMKQHRSWHRIEEIVFDGQIRTKCEHKECPFVVHSR